jgi:hypothetical protein
MIRMSPCILDHMITMMKMIQGVCWCKIGDRGSRRLPTKVLLQSSSDGIFNLPQGEKVSPEALSRFACNEVN